jgi:hypothetical protein
MNIMSEPVITRTEFSHTLAVGAQGDAMRTTVFSSRYTANTHEYLDAIIKLTFL